MGGVQARRSAAVPVGARVSRRTRCGPLSAVRMAKLILASALTLVATASAVLAAPGDLDTTFGGDGKVTTRFNAWAAARDVAVQADGKIVAVGQADGGRRARFAIARYDTDGTLDTTFGGDGKVTTRFKGGAIAYDVAVQSDGRIVAVGDSGGTFAIARYDTDGTLDTTFGGDGKVKTAFEDGDAGARAAAIQADGRVVVGGEWISLSCCPPVTTFALARYEPDGTLDTTFGTGGRVTTAFGDGGASAAGVALQADGKIVAVGNGEGGFALARYMADGTLDATFSDDGQVTTRLTEGVDQGHAVAIQADGKIVAAGTASFCCEYTGSFGLVRYNGDGTLDTTFSDDGIVITNLSKNGDSAGDVAVQPDGKIVAAGGAGYNGSSSAFALVRYQSNGTLDTGFSGNGKVKTRFAPGINGFGGAALQANGKIVSAGWAFDYPATRFALVRYLST